MQSNPLYTETLLFKESDEKTDKVWRLQTSEPGIARRVRRKSGFRQVARSEWGPCPIWIFRTEYSSRAKAIRSLSRILGMECVWDKKRQVITGTEFATENAPQR